MQSRKKVSKAVPGRLERARQRFERWRKTRKRRRIPEALWARAVALTCEYGVHRTAQALRLNDDSLRKRVASSAVAASGSPGSASGFWEVVPGGPVGAAVRGDAECTVELEDGVGTKLRIHWKGGQVPDASELRRTFWSAA